MNIKPNLLGCSIVKGEIYMKKSMENHPKGPWLGRMISCRKGWGVRIEGCHRSLLLRRMVIVVCMYRPSANVQNINQLKAFKTIDQAA